MQISDNSARSIDAACKVIGIIALGLSALFTAGTYVINTHRAAAKPFLDGRLAIYLETTEATATIATTNNDEQRIQAKARFWSLYWGKIAVVEDEPVQKAMESIAECLRNRCEPKEVRKLLPGLINACRNSVRESWGVHISTDPLTNLDIPQPELPTSKIR
jgi:hypothetical protein